MKITLINTGKTKEKYIYTGMQGYISRLQRYVKFDLIEIPDPKKRSNDIAIVKEFEGKQILSRLSATNYVILLDERGKEYTSMEFASHLNQLMINPGKDIVCITGGAFGFSPDIYSRGNESIALSKLTFSHQLVRLVFLEQLYRSFTIIRGEPYHHQ